MKRICFIFILLSFTFCYAEIDFLPKNKPHKPDITVSKETTYLTEPLASDGAIDYVAALNKIESTGVTADNNAHLSR